MDTRRLSAILGFTLLTGCVIGVVILIHNSGSTRRSSIEDQSGVAWSRAKGGFASDPNYRSSQPTMQEVNDLAGELQRILSKTKQVKGQKPTVPTTQLAKPARNGTADNSSRPFLQQSATSSATKASISAINYGIAPNLQKQSPPVPSNSSASAPPSGASSLVFANKNAKPRGEAPPQGTPTPTSLPPLHHQHLTKALLESFPNLQQQQHQGQDYPGHQSRRKVEPKPGMMPPSSERGGSHNDLYTTSWQQAMLPPGVQSQPPLSKHQQPPPPPYHHRQQHDPRQHHNQHPHNRRRFNTKINGNDDGAKKSPQSLRDKQQQPYPHSVPNINRHQQGRPPAPPTKWWEDDFDDAEMSGEDDDGNDVVDLDDNGPGHRQDGDEEEEEGEEEEYEDDDAQPKNFAAELETLLDLANHLYTSGANGSAFQGFLKVINETIERSNNSKLLVELNEMYKRRDPSSSVSSSPTSRKSNFSSIATLGGSTSSSSLPTVAKQQKPSYETSLTAFVFMSFGVFLLNQIHSFVQKTTSNLSRDSGGNNSISGRAFETDFEWYHSPVNSIVLAKEPSTLDILFEPPHSSTLSSSRSEKNRTTRTSDSRYENISVPSSTSIHSPLENSSTPQSNGRGEGSPSKSSSAMGSEEESSAEKIMTLLPDDDDDDKNSPRHHESDISGGESATSVGGDGVSRSMEDNSFSSSHVNNMFRALLNIVNAYTKSSPALDCVWSLYCQDLDKTAEKQGLYGVAARINSVGLRLIMNQIPPALTMDVILRSLVGWDGLPCQKMFPECTTSNGTFHLIKDATKLESNIL